MPDRLDIVWLMAVSDEIKVRQGARESPRVSHHVNADSKA